MGILATQRRQDLRAGRLEYNSAMGFVIVELHKTPPTTSLLIRDSHRHADDLFRKLIIHARFAGTRGLDNGEGATVSMRIPRRAKSMNHGLFESTSSFADVLLIPGFEYSFG